MFVISRAKEALGVWLFWGCVCFIVCPSKRTAITWAVFLGGLVLLTFIVVIVGTILVNSIKRFHRG